MNIIGFSSSGSRSDASHILLRAVSRYYKEDHVRLLHYEDLSINPVDPLMANILKDADFILYVFQSDATEEDKVLHLLLELSKNGTENMVLGNIPTFIVATTACKESDDTAKVRFQEQIVDLEAAGVRISGKFLIPTLEVNYTAGRGISNLLLRSQLEAEVRKTKRAMMLYLKDKQSQ